MIIKSFSATVLGILLCCVVCVRGASASAHLAQELKNPSVKNSHNPQPIFSTAGVEIGSSNINTNIYDQPKEKGKYGAIGKIRTNENEYYSKARNVMERRLEGTATKPIGIAFAVVACICAVAAVVSIRNKKRKLSTAKEQEELAQVECTDAFDNGVKIEIPYHIAPEHSLAPKRPQHEVIRTHDTCLPTDGKDYVAFNESEIETTEKSKVLTTLDTVKKIMNYPVGKDVPFSQTTITPNTSIPGYGVGGGTLNVVVQNPPGRVHLIKSSGGQWTMASNRGPHAVTPPPSPRSDNFAESDPPKEIDCESTESNTSVALDATTTTTPVSLPVILTSERRIAGSEDSSDSDDVYQIAEMIDSIADSMKNDEAMITRDIN